jgi:hypothetical protein
MSRRQTCHNLRCSTWKHQGSTTAAPGFVRLPITAAHYLPPMYAPSPPSAVSVPDTNALVRVNGASSQHVAFEQRLKCMLRCGLCISAHAADADATATASSSGSVVVCPISFGKIWRCNYELKVESDPTTRDGGLESISIQHDRQQQQE